MTEPRYAPGPYATQDIGCLTSFHAYVVDANGRKIGVAWGPVAEKVWTQALFAASLDMLVALKECRHQLFKVCEERDLMGDPQAEAITKADAAIAKIEGEPYSSGNGTES